METEFTMKQMRHFHEHFYFITDDMAKVSRVCVCACVLDCSLLTKRDIQVTLPSSHLLCIMNSLLHVIITRKSSELLV